MTNRLLWHFQHPTIDPLLQAPSVTVLVLKSVAVGNCHSIRFSVQEDPFLGPKNCHRSWIVQLTGVTVTDRASNVKCSDIVTPFAIPPAVSQYPMCTVHLSMQGANLIALPSFMLRRIFGRIFKITS